MAGLIQLDAGRFQLEGELDLAAVAELARDPAPLFERRRLKPGQLSGQVLELDLSGVTQTTTAAVALLLEWIARTQAAGGQLEIRHWPDSMADIARFSNVAELLGIPDTKDQPATSAA